MPLIHATKNQVGPRITLEAQWDRLIAKRPKTTVKSVLDAQDALAHQIFDLHRTAEDLSPDLAESARMIEEFWVH